MHQLTWRKTTRPAASRRPHPMVCVCVLRVRDTRARKKERGRQKEQVEEVEMLLLHKGRGAALARGRGRCGKRGAWCCAVVLARIGGRGGRAQEARARRSTGKEKACLSLFDCVLRFREKRAAVPMRGARVVSEKRSQMLAECVCVCVCEQDVWFVVSCARAKREDVKSERARAVHHRATPKTESRQRKQAAEREQPRTQFPSFRNKKRFRAGGGGGEKGV